MDIQLEKNSGTEALIKIKLKEADYQPKFKEKLKSYSKQANIKGFRPGKVPIGVIEKMYGKSIMVEEINKILVDSLKDYISKNDIKIIGDPLPNNEKAQEIDWDTQKEFDFEYSIGLIDEFEYKLGFKINKFQIKVEKKVLDEAIDNLKEGGLEVGMIRPQTLFPFPEAAIEAAAGKSSCRAVVSVEMSMGQMVEDIQRCVQGKKPVHWFGKCGGDVPTPEEVVDFINTLL